MEELEALEAVEVAPEVAREEPEELGDSEEEEAMRLLVGLVLGAQEILAAAEAAKVVEEWEAGKEIRV
jgi:hypothetical protein